MKKRIMTICLVIIVIILVIKENSCYHPVFAHLLKLTSNKSVEDTFLRIHQHFMAPEIQRVDLLTLSLLHCIFKPLRLLRMHIWAMF